MRELVYLSDRKLRQFQADRRGGLWRRVRQVGVTAPASLGRVDVALSDQTAAQHPDLAKVLKHIERSDRPALPYTEPGLEPGEWMRFKARLNYDIVTEVAGQDLKAAPPLIFWEPQPRQGAPDPVRLLLHGSPEHLVGVPIDAVPVRTVESIGSTIGHFARLLAELRSLTVESQSELNSFLVNPVHQAFPFELSVHYLLRQLGENLPPETASWMAGYARVTANLEFPPGIQPERVVVATPLYVEQTSASA